VALDIPKRIWLLWNQGIDHAPLVARLCVESWVRHNPDWDVTILNGETLCHWADPVLCQPKAQSLVPVRLNELARLSLLARHGGVWADPTVYCMKPLDEWLPGYLESGFFAFANPAPDRVMSSWFLVSSPGGYLSRRMWEELSRYYLSHTLHLSAEWLGHAAPGTQPLLSSWRQSLASLLTRLLDRNSRLAQLWLVPPLPQLGLTPYFSFHYMFARLLRVDPTFRGIWERTVKVSADGPHRLQSHGLDQPLSQDLFSELDDRRMPMYKLNWRVDPRTLLPSSTLNVLLNRY
jgi:hypothetical protein